MRPADECQPDREQLIRSLKRRLTTLAPKEGDVFTTIPELSIHRRNSITEPMPCIYELGLALTLSGEKRITTAQEVIEYKAGEALLASIDLPVSTKVIKASSTEPYIGLMLRFDHRLILQIATDLDLHLPKGSHAGSALCKNVIDIQLLTAFDRLVSLFDEPKLTAALAPLIIHEIIARILLSPLGPNFMALNSGGTPGHQIVRSMSWLKQHFDESISIDTLAEQVQMSPSTYRQHFKHVSGMSPLQYLKQIRLQEARQLMLNAGLDAGTSGLKVGYESVSQFSREYARLFGAPPVKDIKQLRSQIQ